MTILSAISFLISLAIDNHNGHLCLQIGRNTAEALSHYFHPSHRVEHEIKTSDPRAR